MCVPPVLVNHGSQKKGSTKLMMSASVTVTSAHVMMTSAYVLVCLRKRLRDEAEIDFDRKPVGREREALNSWTLLDFGRGMCGS